MCTAKVQEVRKYVLPAAALLFVGTALGAAGGADVTITKPYIRWLFGGFGFQNSEANFVALMPDDFRDQRVLKTFAEISPSFSRVYTGFADESKEGAARPFRRLLRPHVPQGRHHPLRRPVRDAGLCGEA